eukprot:27728_1
MDLLSIIHLRVSDQYLQFLQYADSIDVDPGVYTAVNIGFLSGIFLLTTLILFPGEPFDFTVNNDEGDDDNNNSNNRHFAKHGDSSTNKSENDNRKMMEGKGNEGNYISGALNFIFYGGVFSGVKVLILDPYGISLKNLFIWQFPKEAAVIGLA